MCFRKNDDYEIGKALGYPEEACRAFATVIHGERRDATYAAVQIARAKKSGVALPTWLAYVTWVPDEMDIIAGHVSQSTEQLARMHQLIVREFNPDLARRVERNFKEDTLPISWRLQPNGRYAVQYPIF